VIFEKELFGRTLPVMLISYLGAAKTWFYMFWFKRWGPSAYSLRAPAALAGVALIWLLRALLVRARGERAAVVGCALLAADTMFLLTNTFDWGPVAIQHLTLIGGVVLLVRFHRTRSLASLAGGFFLFGLGLWDKALFLWTLGGVGVAGLLVYGGEIRRALSFRVLAVALAAGSLGAFPLLVYNYETDIATIRGNARWTASEFGFKSHVLHVTLNGSALFGWLASEDPQLLGTAGQALEPRTAIERCSAALSAVTGNPRIGFLAFALAAALAAAPLLWATSARRPLLFGWVALAVTWVQMAITKDAGAGVHHTVLLWPLPHFLVAVSFDALAERIPRLGPRIVAAAMAIVCARGVLVTNSFLTQAARNRGTVQWTDAIYPLSRDLGQRRAEQVLVMDWGILDSLRLLNRGRLPLQVGSDPFQEGRPAEEARRAAGIWTTNPANVFVGHTEGNEFFAGVSARLERAATEAARRKETLRIIHDTNGRPVFEVYRYVAR
jgi:hypothetical protein